MLLILQYVINLDSEDKEALCLGSAGGGDVTMKVPAKREHMDGIPLSVAISGLSGGHSGCDIHLYKANAFKVIQHHVMLSPATVVNTYASSCLEHGILTCQS